MHKSFSQVERRSTHTDASSPLLTPPGTNQLWVTLGSLLCPKRPFTPELVQFKQTQVCWAIQSGQADENAANQTMCSKKLTAQKGL